MNKNSSVFAIRTTGDNSMNCDKTQHVCMKSEINVAEGHQLQFEILFNQSDKKYFQCKQREEQNIQRARN